MTHRPADMGYAEGHVGRTRRRSCAPKSETAPRGHAHRYHIRWVSWDDTPSVGSMASWWADHASLTSPTFSIH
jgi:hypothetical protein